MNQVADKLREARALIERGWTKGWFARNAKGRPVTAKRTGTAATCFCAIGALIRVTGRDEYTIEREPEYRTLATAAGVMWVDDWNDDPDRTQYQVLAAFDRAIELAEASA